MDTKEFSELGYTSLCSTFANSKLSTNRYESLPDVEQLIECKVYRRRWLMLALFTFYSMSNAFQWIEYSIIANIIQKYYNVPSTYVDWTSMIFMITYIPLIFPASWFLDKVGLRVALVIGALGNCLGAWIKVASVSPDLFYVSFLGQTVAAISQIFILNIPAPLAAVWFGPDEVSLACSVGVFGNQLGIALGFLIPPIIVKNSENLQVIASGLTFLFYGVAAVTTFILFLIVCFFQASPKLPPSPAQAVQRATESKGFINSVKQLVLNPGYRLLLISYGVNGGVFYAISTLLNQVVLFYFPGSEEDAGRIGLTIVVAGMLGSLVCGVILDRTHRFKETALSVYTFALLGMLVYTMSLSTGFILIVYIVAGLLGFFMTGYLSVGFEFAAELTYPEPEGTSAGLLNASVQVFGILSTMFYSWMFYKYGDVWANVTLCGALFIGTIFTALIKSDLRRQAAHKSNTTKP